MKRLTLLFIFILMGVQSISFGQETIEFDLNNGVKLDSGWKIRYGALINPVEFQAHSNEFETIDELTDWNSFNPNWNNHGFATYYLKVKLANGSVNINRLLGINVPPPYSAYKLWINGQLVGESGKVGKTKEKTSHQKIHKSYSFDINNVSNTNEVEIVWQVSNFYHYKGGVTTPPVISYSTTTTYRSNIKLISDGLFIGSLFFIGFLFLLFYWFYWRKDKAVLFFAIFVLCWAYQRASEHYAPFDLVTHIVPRIIFVKLEYISLIFGSLMGSLYYYKIFEKENFPLYRKLLKYICGASILFVLLTPASWFTRILPFFFGFMILNIIFIIFFITNAYTLGRRGSALGFISILLGCITAIVHIYFFMNPHNVQILILNLLYLLVFLLSGLLLTIRFAESFKKLEIVHEKTVQQKGEIEKQSEIINQNNEELNAQSEMLIKKNETIYKINQTLEQKVERRTKSLIKANQELDSFLYKSSHDLRRPITSAIGLLNIIEKDEDKDEIKNILNKLGYTLKEMDRLIKKLSLVSEVNIHTNKPIKIPVQTILENSKNKAIKNRIRKDQIDFKYTGPKVIQTDGFLIDIIITELLKNSFHWADVGSLSVHVHCEIQETEDTTVLIVTDDGPGIEADRIEKAFDMFVVLNTNTATQGLGLYIVKRAVEKLSGKIKVNSRIGEGTSFKIIIPKSIDLNKEIEDLLV